MALSAETQIESSYEGNRLQKLRNEDSPNVMSSRKGLILKNYYKWKIYIQKL